MNKKIFALLIVLIAAISVAGVYAEGLVSHDFGQFKMDIPNAPEAQVSEKVGGDSINHTIFSIPNPDGSLFCYVDYFNTTHTNGNNNTTDFILSKLNEKYSVKMEDGMPTWTYEGGTDHGYLVSSDDDTQVITFQGSDVYLKDAVNSVEFK